MNSIPNDSVRKLSDGQIGYGSVSRVERTGERVHRPAGEWTPAVHDLLRHLERVGFAESPHVIGIDSDGAEVLTYISGEVAMRPWPECLAADAGIVELAGLLQRYHQAVASYTPPVNAKWRVPGAVWRPSQIVRHGDLGPWNIVWRKAAPVGIIDWDFAEPGYPIEDVGQLAWYAVPLRVPEKSSGSGIEAGRTQVRRFRLLCETYGVDAGTVVETVLELQHREMQRIVGLGKAGLQPWRFFLERGDVEEIRGEISWLTQNRNAF